MAQSSIVTKKKKSTIGPFECDHCGFIWYGLATKHRSAPNTVLCSTQGSRCWHILDLYMIEKYGVVCPHHEEALQDGAAWVANKEIKPYPRKLEKRFHRSVPKWMQSAIDKGLVKTNSEDVYTVTVNELGEAISVEVSQQEQD